MWLELGMVAIWGLLCLTGFTLLTSLFQSVAEDEASEQPVCCVGKDEECH